MTTPTREKRDRSNFSDRKSSIFPPSQLGVDFSFVTQGILPLVPSLDPPPPHVVPCSHFVSSVQVVTLNAPTETGCLPRFHKQNITSPLEIVK